MRLLVQLLLGLISLLMLCYCSNQKKKPEFSKTKSCLKIKSLVKTHNKQVRFA